MAEKDNEVKTWDGGTCDQIAGRKFCDETCVTSIDEVGNNDSHKPNTVELAGSDADDEISPEVTISQAASVAETCVGVNGNYESDVRPCIEVVDPWWDICNEETRQKIIAEAFCPECNSFMCKSCIDMHKKVPASRKHRLQREESMPKSQSDKPIKLEECEIHVGNQCDRFCYNHDSMICDHCVEHQCTQTITNIEEKCREKCCNITKCISSLANAIQDLDQAISYIDNTLKGNVDPLKFKYLQDIAKSTQQQKIEIDSLHKQLSKIELYFVTSSKTLAELGSIKHLGEVKEVASESYALKRLPDISLPQAIRIKTETPPRDKTEIQVTQLNQLIIKAPNNKMSCDITSMCVTSDGMLLLTDYNNGSTKVLSGQTGLQYSVSLSKKPLAIAKIDELTAAISTDDKRVYVLDISILTNIKIKWSFHLSYLVTGMAPCCGGLVVVSKRKQPCIVKLINIHGHELWSLSAKPCMRECFNLPESVTAITLDGKATIIITDSGNSNIRVMNAVNGDVIKTIDCDGKNPYGLTTDNDANVYVSCKRTKEIYMYSADFKRRKLLLTASDLPSNPGFIVFCENNCVLYVSSLLGDTIARYELS